MFMVPSLDNGNRGLWEMSGVAPVIQETAV